MANISQALIKIFSLCGFDFIAIFWEFIVFSWLAYAEFVIFHCTLYSANSHL